VHPSRDELYVLGTEAFERGDLATAEGLLQRLLESGAAYPDVLNRLGLAAHQRGDFAKALACFARALDLNPRYNEAALNLAVTLMDLGRYAEAERVYYRAHPGGLAAAHEPSAALDPFIKGKLANREADLAGAYHALGLLDQAVESFEAALNLCPGFPDIRLKLGVALRDAGRPDEALSEFTRVQEEAPHLAMAGVQKGITRYVTGDLEGAVGEWEAVLAIHPGHPRAEMYLRLVGRAARRRSA
jgi:tetratricopeptide (TPR) repeat protein